MKRAVLYLRVSTQDQTTANQERELRQVAERAGWQIVQVYKDHGISGAKGRDKRPLDSRAKCNRALREPDLHVFAKLFENCLKRSLEAKAFSGREIGGDDDVLDFLVGHFVDVDLTRQPAS